MGIRGLYFSSLHPNVHISECQYYMTYMSELFSVQYPSNSYWMYKMFSGSCDGNVPYSVCGKVETKYVETVFSHVANQTFKLFAFSLTVNTKFLQHS